ncbi:adhesin [Kitasatospora sp. NE20-6]|uniref:ScbA/BarX family gamma-butyrolactone biosynthesis protein n=1 Tax=Kitasatospora sp. NE20-6 TaxID=2859066 RepID=UPI0034DC3A32
MSQSTASTTLRRPHTGTGPTDPAAPESGPLTTTVPRQFVHRAAVAEVLLTGWQRRDEHRFTVSAQWPRAHTFFTPLRDSLHDPLLVAETIRQTGALLAHAEYGVPLDRHFLLWQLDYTAHEEHLAVGPAPAELTLDVTTEVQHRAGRLAAMHYRVQVRRGDAVLATGSAQYTCTTPGVYDRLRGDRRGAVPSETPPAPVPARYVGRTDPRDVVLAPTDRSGVWQLRYDPHHPVLFDHPCDHVPGMVLLEASRQAARAALGSPRFLPVSALSVFGRYAEFDSPCLIGTSVLPADRPGTAIVNVTGHQDGHEVFNTLLTALV